MKRTEQEKEKHKKAIKIRKMTDEQICDYLKRVEMDAYNDGFITGGMLTVKTSVKV